jgi:alkylation response protein AidB-like acyl-CoA dehydrogenase
MIPDIGNGAPSPLLAAARRLVPFVAAQAAANEAGGRLTDATVAALNDSGLLGMWIPQSLGGTEAGPVEGLEIIEAVSYADGSTGWVLMATQVAMGSAAAYLDPAVARKIFDGRFPIVAGQGAAIGRAEPVADGYRLSGHWSYGSGVNHAEYLHTGAVIHENGTPRLLPGSAVPDVRIFIVPIGEAELLGNWDVLGLKATGSIDYTLTDVFVPEAWTHPQQTAVPRSGGSLYRLGIAGISAICHTGFTLGVGRRMLDELAALARAESGRPSLLPLRGGGESFHEQFGLAEAKLRAARAFAFETWNDVKATLDAGGDASVRQGTLFRLALNHVTVAVAEVTSFAYLYGGGVALRPGILQRCFCDMHAATQHITTGKKLLQECARELLAIAPGKIWGNRGLIDPS